MNEAWRSGGVSDEQSDLAIVGKPAYGIDQGIAAGVVETVGDLDPILVKLIIQLQELEGLSCADRARAQDCVDGDALRSQVITHLTCVTFAVRREPPLPVLTARSGVLGLGMTKYEQGASLIHLRSLMSGVCIDRDNDVAANRGVDAMFEAPVRPKVQRFQTSRDNVLEQSLPTQADGVP
jgi:hypothetical protein